MALALLTALPAVRGGFHYDDAHSVSLNPHIRSLDRPWRFFADPGQFSRDPDKAMYRPLVVLSLAVNYAISGGSPWSYLATNVAIHSLASVAVWWLAVALGASPRGALVAGALFAVHPLCSEPVNYVSARSESMAAGLGLWAMAQWIRRGRAVTVLVFLAAMCKSTAIVLLPAMVMADLALSKSIRQWKHYLPGVAVVLSWLAISGGWLTRSVSHTARPMWPQLLTQAKALPYYLWKIGVPVHLNVEPQFSVSYSAGTIHVLAVLAVLSALVVAYRTASPACITLGCMAMLWAAPTAIMPLNVLVNERRAYMLVAVACVAVGLWWRRR